MAGWAARHGGLLVECSTLADVVDRIQRSELEPSRALCWVLLEETAAGDEIAAQTMLQVLVPAMRKVVHRWLGEAGRQIRWQSRTEFDAERLLVANVTRVVLEYSTRRLKWPIADILRRGVHLTVQQVRRERVWLEHRHLESNDVDTLDDLVDRDALDIRSPSEELREVLEEAVAMGVITAQASEMVQLTRLDGFSPAEVSERFAMTPDTFRRARLRAERRLIDAASKSLFGLAA